VGAPTARLTPSDASALLVAVGPLTTWASHSPTPLRCVREQGPVANALAPSPRQPRGGPALLLVRPSGTCRRRERWPCVLPGSINLTWNACSIN